MQQREMFRGWILIAMLIWPAVVWSEPVQNYTNSIGMEFVLVAPGSFQMGSLHGETVPTNETPAHRVEIDKPFYLGKYEVTQAQWEALMKNNPSHFKDPNRPVEQISWEEARQFVRKMNAKEKVKVYRLPTEAEWEYAARAGTTTRFHWGEQEQDAGRYAWYGGNAGGQTHPVGQKQPNAWGLYDVAGNVWEWCQDWYDAKYYQHSPKSNPIGPDRGMDFVVRGGGWHNAAPLLRSAIRYHDTPNGRSLLTGVRIAMDVRSE